MNGFANFAELYQAVSPLARQFQKKNDSYFLKKSSIEMNPSLKNPSLNLTCMVFYTIFTNISSIPPKHMRYEKDYSYLKNSSYML
jgi:hypothetical protein